MVDINHRQRVIKVKLVYYGPAVCGKTTNLKVLFERAAGARRGQFVSVNSAQDRTILCDLLPLRTGGFRGYDLKVQLLAVPGQPMYGATRRVVLKGADGVVFVANSADDRWQENLQSLQEMVANLLAQQIDASRVPLVFQYNKRDLPAVVELSVLSRALNGRHVPEFPAVAAKGEGVLETFASILDPHDRGPLPSLRDAAAAAGADRGGLGEAGGGGDVRRPEAGRAGGGGAGPEPAETVEHLKVRVPTADEDSGRGAAGGAEGRAGLAHRVLRAGLRRARASRQRAARGARPPARPARRGAAGPRARDRGPGEDRRRGAPAGDPEGAREGGRGLGGHAAALHRRGAAGAGPAPARADPLSRTTWGVAHLEGARGLTEPQLEEASSSGALAQALCAGEPSFEAVALVPLRSAERLLGLALLYFGPYAALPPADAVDAPRLPVPRARGPARGLGRARGGLGRRPAQRALEGLGRRRRLAADAPALGSRAPAAAPAVRRPGSAGRHGRVDRGVVSRGLGAGRHAAPALRLCQPHPPVRGRRAREGPDPGGGGAGRAGRRRGARARHRGRAQLR